MTLRGNLCRDCKPSKWWPLLYMYPAPGLQLWSSYLSVSSGITAWSNFLLQNEMEGAGRIWIQEESLPSLPESLPVSFNTHSSSQWHLCIAAYFRKSHFSVIHIPYANSRPSIERIIWSSSTSLCSSFHTGEFLSICSSIPHFCLSFLPFSKSSAPHWRMPSHLTFILFRFPFGELFIWMPSQFFLTQTQHFCSRMHTPCSHRYVWLWSLWERSVPKSYSSKVFFNQTHKEKFLIDAMEKKKKKSSPLSSLCISSSLL